MKVEPRVPSAIYVGLPDYVVDADVAVQWAFDLGRGTEGFTFTPDEARRYGDALHKAAAQLEAYLEWRESQQKGGGDEG